MKKIQIACVPAQWDDSTLTVLGLVRNGRRALPVTLTAGELPEPWLAIWHGLVDALRGVAPGEWAATFIECQLAVDENGTPAVRLVIQRRWDDATTAEPVELLMGGEAVSFFEYLTQ